MYYLISVQMSVVLNFEEGYTDLKSKFDQLLLRLKTSKGVIAV